MKDDEEMKMMSMNENEEFSIQRNNDSQEPNLGIMYFTIFLQSITFTIVLPSLWFYIKEVKLIENQIQIIKISR